MFYRHWGYIAKRTKFAEGSLLSGVLYFGGEDKYKTHTISGVLKASEEKMKQGKLERAGEKAAALTYWF